MDKSGEDKSLLLFLNNIYNLYLFKIITRLVDKVFFFLIICMHRLHYAILNGILK